MFDRGSKKKRDSEGKMAGMEMQLGVVEEGRGGAN